MDKKILLPKKSKIQMEQGYFVPEKTFECGQCFRWRQVGADPFHYIGVVSGALLEIKSSVQHPWKTEVKVLAGEISAKRFSGYFDLSENYAAVSNEILGNCAVTDRAVRYGAGIRLLRQDPFETLISFIISANNNIPKIKMTIEDLCAKFGRPLGTDPAGEMHYSFPAAADIAANSGLLKDIRAIGYRARSVSEAAEKSASGQFSCEDIFSLDYEDAKKHLKTLHGVGDKVANCILLFTGSHRQSFPVDTWVKKLLLEFYGVEKDHQNFVDSHFPVHRGLAQQYLFYYIRQIKAGKVSEPAE